MKDSDKIQYVINELKDIKKCVKRLERKLRFKNLKR